MIIITIISSLIVLYYFYAYKILSKAFSELPKKTVLKSIAVSPLMLLAYLTSTVAAYIYKKLDIYIYFEVAYHPPIPPSQLSMQDMRDELERSGVQVMSLEDLKKQLEEARSEISENVPFDQPTSYKKTYH